MMADSSFNPGKDERVFVTSEQRHGYIRRINERFYYVLLDGDEELGESIFKLSELTPPTDTPLQERLNRDLSDTNNSGQPEP